MKQTFASKTFAAFTFACGTLTGAGVVQVTEQPGLCSVTAMPKWTCATDLAQKWECELTISPKWTCDVEVQMVSIPDGNIMVVTSTFTLTSTGKVADPTTVTTKVRDPENNLVTDTASQVSSGVYKSEIAIAEGATKGTREVRVYGTGAVVASNYPLEVEIPESFVAGN